MPMVNGIFSCSKNSYFSKLTCTARARSIFNILAGNVMFTGKEEYKIRRLHDLNCFVFKLEKTKNEEVSKSK